MKKENTVARVTSDNDPAKAGRIKVAVQSMDGGEYPEWLEPVFQPGWFGVPSVGETVEITLPEGEDIVEFADEVKYLGVVFDGAHPAPDDFKENYPKRRGFFNPSGHLLLFDDDDGIVLTVGALAGNNIGVTIDATTGQVKIYGLLGVQIESQGAIVIKGTTCTIQDRPVIGGGPI